MKELSTTMPVKTEIKNFIVRLGIIFSNISIFSLILCYFGILSFISTAFILLVGLVIIVLTIGTIFIIVPDYFNIFMSVTDISAKVSAFFLDNFYLFISITILSSILSLILILLNKQTRYIGRIIFSVIIVIIAMFTIIIIAMGVV
ncbi:MAG: hypothetical protein ACLUG4_09470 [Bacilli bacterium]|jgi:hypothetical protein|nr:hypothetical protein [Staphylococcus sp.]